MSAVRDVYQRAIRAYNEGDVDGFADAHAVNAVLVTPSATLEGRAAIRDYWCRVRNAFPDLVLTVVLLLEQGDIVVTEWHESGTNTGPLVRADGTVLPPTGNRIDHSGMEIARVRDGKIVEYRMYWDRTAIALQLGHSPASVSG